MGEHNRMPVKTDKKDIEDNKIIAALGYVSILCFVPLFLKRDSKFAQFHAKQGLLLFIIEIFSFIPLIGQIAFILAIAAAIWGAKNALNGKYWQIPIIGQYTKKLNI